MIYILTNHHATPDWISLQSRILELRTSEYPYKVFCGVTDIEGELPQQPKNYQFDPLEGTVNRHADKMNRLFEIADADHPSDDDLIIFLDPDAFPITDKWIEGIRQVLSKFPLLAISREENIEPLLREDQKPYPHPCFTATTYKFWKQNSLSWELNVQEGASCAGVMLKKWLEENNYKWAKILRSNVYDLHPLNYAVYGEMIYHHGSGNRPTYDSVDIWSRPTLSQKYGAGVDLHYPGLLNFNDDVSALVLEYIKKDDDFINYYFLGR